MMGKLEWRLGRASFELAAVYQNDVLVHVIVKSINHVVERRNVVI